jgi:hypothetical protein
MTKDLVRIGGLILLEVLLDIAFSLFYPMPINPFRATLISAVALLVLLGVDALKKGLINPYIGGISIFLAAYLGSILVQEGYLASKSWESGLAHVVILTATFILVSRVFGKPKEI